VQRLLGEKIKISENIFQDCLSSKIV